MWGPVGFLAVPQAAGPKPPGLVLLLLLSLQFSADAEKVVPLLEAVCYLDLTLYSTGRLEKVGDSASLHRPRSGSARLWEWTLGEWGFKSMVRGKNPSCHHESATLSPPDVHSRSTDVRTK